MKTAQFQNDVCKNVDAPVATRKKYKKPVLIVFGNIAQLTSSTDHGGSGDILTGFSQRSTRPIRFETPTPFR